MRHVEKIKEEKEENETGEGGGEKLVEERNNAWRGEGISRLVFTMLYAINFERL